MEKLRCTKTYERNFQKHKLKESQQLSDLFDKVAEKHKSVQENQQTRRRRTLGRNTSVLKKSFPNKVVPHTSSKGKTEGLGSQLSSEESPAKQTFFGLFDSPIFDAESSPKRARHVKAVGRQKGVKKAWKKSSMPFPTHSTHSQSVAQCTSTPVSVSPDYPSIETFRDRKPSSFDWSFVYEELERSHHKTYPSLSESCTEMHITPDTMECTDRPFIKPQPWNSAGVRKRSFVKIKTPTESLGESSQYKRGNGKSKHSGVDDSSYTSLYTWVTASNTDTRVAQTATTSKQNSCCFTGSSVEVALEEKPADVNSPTLVFKSCLRDNLHSTAISSHQDIQHLQQTPQVSPIKNSTDADQNHHTPSAPTQDVSPRGPRKTQSFISMPARSVAPKCSTMLFSPLADAGGDAPLDISSIRKALPGAMDPKDDAEKEHQTSQKLSIEETDDKVLTSTPNRCASTKLKWNLSSVQAVEEDDELVPLQTSRDTVNSQEIVTASYSDISIALFPLQDSMEYATVEELHGGDDSFNRRESEVETDLDCAKQIYRENVDTHMTYPEKLGKVSLAQIAPLKYSLPGTSAGTDSKLDEKDESLGVEPDNHVDGRGDGCRNDEDLPCHDRQYAETSERNGQQTGGLGSVLCKHSKTDYTNDCGKEGDGDTAIAKIKQDEVKTGQSWHQRIAPSVEQVDICPVSASGHKDLSYTPRRSTSMSGLQMWVQTADSGFLDMLATTPPDTIGLLSRKSREKRNTKSVRQEDDH